MTTHTHPEIETQILELSKTTTSEIGDSEERLRADMYKIRDELKSDIVGLETSVGGLESKMDSQSGRMDSLEGKLNDVQEDVKAIKDFLLPPKP